MQFKYFFTRQFENGFRHLLRQIIYCDTLKQSIEHTVIIMHATKLKKLFAERTHTEPVAFSIDFD